MGHPLTDEQRDKATSESAGDLCIGALALFVVLVALAELTQWLCHVLVDG